MGGGVDCAGERQAGGGAVDDAEAAEHLEGVLAEEQALVRRRIGPVVPVRQALVRRDVLLLSVVYFCWSLGAYGFVLWLPTIVKEGSAMAMGRVGAALGGALFVCDWDDAGGVAVLG